MKYFTNPQTLEDLKKQYRELSLKHHPDRDGGDTETMKIINNEYDELFKILKDVHKTKDGETYTAKQETSETPEQFKNIIDELMRMDDVIIEIIGGFIRLTGNTNPYNDKIKELKFQWHSKKIAWYLKPEDYKKRSHKDYELDEIREMYGTNGEVKSKGTVKLNA
jgi:curved DNA-binding protein CbpA